MKHCELIELEGVGGAYVFRGNEWPDEIVVNRSLLEYPQGPHIQFGRRGTLQFFCVNGQATYRRFGEIIDGWVYKLVDGKLPAAPKKVVPIKPAPQDAEPAAARYCKANGKEVEAFQWLPHESPPRALPDWFMRMDFEQNKDGILLIRLPSGPVRAVPGNWLVRDGEKLSSHLPASFADEYVRAA